MSLIRVLEPVTDQDRTAPLCAAEGCYVTLSPGEISQGKEMHDGCA
tara:strand:- start:565 stop:702 length:138 start_codon:yes stop_codon:yes gene_type:complete